jgi:pimeloyl-ACP methyl ester carboxylesterase
VRAFAPGRALAPDLLGYGAQRQVPVEAIDLPAQVEHLYRVLEEQLPGEAVHLVGHSVGGAVAMLFAQVHGERVRSLVSVEGNFSLCEKGGRFIYRDHCPLLAGFCRFSQPVLGQEQGIPTPPIAPFPHC